MEVHAKIRHRRQALGLSDADVAKKVGLSVHEYGDIEMQKEEVFRYPSLHQVKKICAVLNMDCLDLLDLKCRYCEEGGELHKDFLLPRSELIRKRRSAMNMTREELGDRIGFSEEEVEQLEGNPDHLESWSIDYIRDLADALHVPIEILLGMRCGQCEQTSSGLPPGAPRARGAAGSA